MADYDIKLSRERFTLKIQGALESPKTKNQYA